MKRKTLQRLERALWHALDVYKAEAKANPTCPEIKSQRESLTKLWLFYNEKIKVHDLAAAAKEPIVFTSFLPSQISKSCTTEIRRTKNFSLKGYWWHGQPPTDWNVERKPLYSDPMNHFAAIQRGSAFV